MLMAQFEPPVGKKYACKSGTLKTPLNPVEPTLVANLPCPSTGATGGHSTLSPLLS